MAIYKYGAVDVTPENLTNNLPKWCREWCDSNSVDINTLIELIAKIGQKKSAACEYNFYLGNGNESKFYITRGYHWWSDENRITDQDVVSTEKSGLDEDLKYLLKSIVYLRNIYKIEIANFDLQNPQDRHRLASLIYTPSYIITNLLTTFNIEIKDFIELPFELKELVVNAPDGSLYNLARYLDWDVLSGLTREQLYNVIALSPTLPVLRYLPDLSVSPTLPYPSERILRRRIQNNIHKALLNLDGLKLEKLVEKQVLWNLISSHNSLTSECWKIIKALDVDTLDILLNALHKRNMQFADFINFFAIAHIDLVKFISHDNISNLRDPFQFSAKTVAFDASSLINRLCDLVSGKWSTAVQRLIQNEYITLEVISMINPLDLNCIIPSYPVNDEKNLFIIIEHLLDALFSKAKPGEWRGIKFFSLSESGLPDGIEKIHALHVACKRELRQLPTSSQRYFDVVATTIDNLSYIIEEKIGSSSPFRDPAVQSLYDTFGEVMPTLEQSITLLQKKLPKFIVEEELEPFEPAPAPR